MVKETLKIKHLPFAVMHKTALKNWLKAKQNPYSPLKPVQTIYINVSDLKEKARQKEKYSKYSPPLVWQGRVGFMSPSWVNEHQGKKEFNYKFGTGLYYCSDHALLVDDLFEWVHGQRKEEDVRSAFDIIRAIQSGKLEI